MARVLVADDNPVSLVFFGEAISQCGHVADTASDGAEACRLASLNAYDLLILDLRMPLRTGAETLDIIRAEPGPSRHAMAIATSADASLDPAYLLDAGFIDLLHKPVSLGAFRDLLAARLPAASNLKLDDECALARSGGDPLIMASLRKLLANELDALPSEFMVHAANSDLVAVIDRLHRLDASAAFCGATALTDAAQALRRAIDAGDCWPTAAMHDFLRVCAETRSLLA